MIGSEASLIPENVALMIFPLTVQCLRKEDWTRPSDMETNNIDQFRWMGRSLILEYVNYLNM